MRTTHIPAGSFYVEQWDEVFHCWQRVSGFTSAAAASRLAGHSASRRVAQVPEPAEEG